MPSASRGVTPPSLAPAPAGPPGGSRTTASVIGTVHARTARAAKRNAQRQPSHSTRACVAGTTRRIPTPMPAEVKPSAAPTRVGNQRCTSTTAGTQPAQATPMAETTPNAA